MANDDSSAGLRGRDLATIGSFLVGAVVGGMLLGIWFDSAFDTSPTGVLVGVAAGIVLACVGFALRVRAALRP